MVLWGEYSLVTRANPPDTCTSIDAAPTPGQGCSLPLRSPLPSPLRVNEEDHEHLSVLIANERRDEHDRLAEVVASLGHVALDGGPQIDEVAEATAAQRPDVALVGLGDDPQDALSLISQLVRQAACPVIAILHSNEPGFVGEAAKRGVFAYLVNGDPDEVRNALAIVLRRFAEFQNLEGALGRRALTERAKGILMERHGLTPQQAFTVLARYSQDSNRKLFEVAEDVVRTGGSPAAQPG